MKSQLELKLNKLPETVKAIDVYFDLHITKFTHKNELVWCIEYKDSADNTLFSIEHTSLQACIDNTLATIKIMKG